MMMYNLNFGFEYQWIKPYYCLWFRFRFVFVFFFVGKILQYQYQQKENKKLKKTKKFNDDDMNKWI